MPEIARECGLTPATCQTYLSTLFLFKCVTREKNPTSKFTCKYTLKKIDTDRLIERIKARYYKILKPDSEDLQIAAFEIEKSMRFFTRKEVMRTIAAWLREDAPGRRVLPMKRIR